MSQYRNQVAEILSEYKPGENYQSTLAKLDKLLEREIERRNLPQNIPVLKIRDQKDPFPFPFQIVEDPTLAPGEWILVGGKK